VTLADVAGQVFMQENLAAEAPEGAAENIGDVRWRLPPDYAGVFVLFLQVVDEEGQVLAENAYLHSAAPEPALAPLLTAPRTRVEVSGQWPVVSGQSGSAPGAPAEGEVTLRNAGEAFALGVRLWAPTGQWFRFGDNYLIIPPGEERVVAADGDPTAVRVSGWNLESDE